MTFDTILQSMQELYSPTICTLILIILIVDTVIIVFAISIFLCDWFAKTVRGIVYRWKHRNDPPKKHAIPGIALGTVSETAMSNTIKMEVINGVARDRRGEPIFQTPGFFCYGCPELKNVRYCAVCRLKRDEKQGEDK